MFEKEAKEYFRVNAYNFDEVTACRECMEFGYNKGKEEACDIINELLINGYDESTREKALNFLYPDKEE